MGRKNYRLWVAYMLNAIVATSCVVLCISGGIVAALAHDRRLVMDFVWALVVVGGAGTAGFVGLGAAVTRGVLHHYGFRGWSAWRVSSDLPLRNPSRLEDWAEAHRANQHYLSDRAVRLRASPLRRANLVALSVLGAIAFVMAVLSWQHLV